MRLSIVAASDYLQNRELPDLPHVAAQLDLLGQRLAEPDAGFFVHIFSAERGLAEGIEQVLSEVREPISEILFYFAGYAVVSEERGAALLLDGDRLSTLSLKRVRRLLEQWAPASFTILDTVSAFDAGRDPRHVVQLLGEAMSSEGSSIHLLASNRAEHSHATGAAPFTKLLELVLDWQSGRDGLSAEALYAAMRAEESLFAELPAAHYFPGQSTFYVLSPGVAPIFTAPPPALHSVPEGAPARAEALAAAGDHEGALAEFTLALQDLGAPPSPAHPPLYVSIARSLVAAGRSADALAYYRAALDIEPRLVTALRGAVELSTSVDGEQALPLLQRWLEVEPDALEASARAAELLGASERWEELAGLYEFVLSRASVPETATEVALQLSALASERLGDRARARTALELAARLSPREPRLQAALAPLFEQQSDAERSLGQVLADLRAAPRRPESLRAALASFERTGNADSAWQAACALEFLGEADINESLLAGAHRPDGLLPARGRVGDREWAEKRFCPERDAATDALFSALGGAAEEVGLETARRKRRLPALDPALEQNPETSTATLAKTLLWTAKLLGLPVPKLYVLPLVREKLLAAPAREPTLIVDRSIGSGLELSELAFLWGRQLTFLRPEHRALVFYADESEISALTLAALSLGGVAALPFKQLEGDSKLFARGLKRHLSRDALRALGSVTARFPIHDAGARMLSWMRTVELAAGRAGLLSCGCVETAARMSQRFPLGGMVSADQAIDDLIVWSVGPEYAFLRERLGVRIQT